MSKNIYESFLVKYDVPRAKGYESGHGEDKEVVLPNQLVGLELEIENAEHMFYAEFGGFNPGSDGSLRNNGVEWTTKPIATKYLRNLLSALFKQFNIGPDNYSERCSTHVHFNAQELTIDQLNSICLIYQTTERLLFGFIGNGRSSSIFCVPWYQSGLTYNIVSKLKTNLTAQTSIWQKYSALNLKTLTQYGTIEFRHLEGTCDVNKICNWVNLISCIFQYSINNNHNDVCDEILKMNTVSNYREWLYKIFGKYADLFDMEHGEPQIARGVIDTKLMLIGNSGLNNSNNLDNLIANWDLRQGPQTEIPVPDFAVRIDPNLPATARALLNHIRRENF